MVSVLVRTNQPSSIIWMRSEFIAERPPSLHVDVNECDFLHPGESHSTLTIEGIVDSSTVSMISFLCRYRASNSRGSLTPGSTLRQASMNPALLDLARARLQAYPLELWVRVHC